MTVISRFPIYMAGSICDSNGKKCKMIAEDAIYEDDFMVYTTKEAAQVNYGVV